MLLIHLRNDQQDEHFHHQGEAFELGRGPRRELPRYFINDLTVSKDQLRVDWQPETQTVALTNLSAKRDILIGGRHTLKANERHQAPLPVRLRVGNSQVLIEEEETQHLQPALRTIERPRFLSNEPATSLRNLGDSPQPETLVRWFETVFSVQRSALDSEDFFAATARAVVDLVGLDRGFVLLRQGTVWVIASEHPTDSASARRLQVEQVLQGSRLARDLNCYSETILARVLEARRTYFDAMFEIPLTDSLTNIEAVVASPILDKQGHVVGVVYGSRFRGTGATQAIRPLEAEVVQLLAAAVAAGMARLDSEREKIAQAEQLAKMQVQLDVVREIQAGFFPRQMPQLTEYEIVGCSHPAYAAGGDYYDVIPLPDGRLGLVVADVSGHGLGPSLLMASLRAILRGMILETPSPARLVTRVNEALFEDLRAQRRKLITMFYGLFDPREHRLEFVNAAQGPVVLHLVAGKTRFEPLPRDDELRGPALGLARLEYAADQVTLAPGDLIVLASDGLAETRRGGEIFGQARIEQALLAHRAAPLIEVRDHLVNACQKFRGRSEPEDDLTLLLLRRTPG